MEQEADTETSASVSPWQPSVEQTQALPPTTSRTSPPQHSREGALAVLYELATLAHLDGRIRLDAAEAYLTHTYQAEDETPPLTPPNVLSTGAVVGPNRDANYDASVGTSGL